MSAPVAAALVVEQLVKRFGDRQVLDGLSFTVQRGEVFALLGPNGAGKTTTVETLEGYHAPDGGRVRVLGEDPRRGGRRLRARLGVMLQEGGIYPALRPPEVARLFARYYPCPLDPNSVLRAVGLERAARTPYRRLSGGEKQRLSLALALIGQPEVLFLDEPTAGMDPQARRQTWELIRTQQARGVTVLLTTHAMDEAEQLADRVAIIHHGRLLALDTPQGLRTAGLADRAVLRVRTRDPLVPADLAALRTIHGVRQDRTGALLLETDDPAAAFAEAATWAQARGVQLTELVLGEASLEEAFLRLTAAGRPVAEGVDGVPGGPTAP